MLRSFSFSFFLFSIWSFFPSFSFLFSNLFIFSPFSFAFLLLFFSDFSPFLSFFDFSRHFEYFSEFFSFASSYSPVIESELFFLGDFGRNSKSISASGPVNKTILCDYRFFTKRAVRELRNFRIKGIWKHFNREIGAKREIWAISFAFIAKIFATLVHFFFCHIISQAFCM